MQEADLAFSFFTLTPERSSVVDPTVPFFVDSSAIVFKKESGPRANYWTFFLGPFHTLVYVAIGACLLLMLPLLMLMEKCHWKLRAGRHQQEPSGEDTILQLMMRYAEVILAGLLIRRKTYLLALPLCLSVSVCLCVCLSACVCVSLPSLSLSLCLCLSVSPLSLSLSLPPPPQSLSDSPTPSLPPSFHLSVCLSVCLCLHSLSVTHAASKSSLICWCYFVGENTN